MAFDALNVSTFYSTELGILYKFWGLSSSIQFKTFIWLKMIWFENTGDILYLLECNEDFSGCNQKKELDMLA